ncbi:MAG: glycosyltransferase family 2 protein [Spirochaetota bacterium]
MATTKKTAKKNKGLLVVVIPAYNEAMSIHETIVNLKKIKSKINKLGLQYRIFVVNDGSSDDTSEIAQKAGADHVVEHKLNRGLGAAVRSGLDAARRAKALIAVKFDADLQHDPNDIPELIRPILDDTADVVYGKRFEKITYKMPFMRKMGNRVFTRIMRFLTKWPLEDSQPGIFAVHNDYLEVFNLPGDYNYTQQVLLDSYHKGMRFAHVSVSFNKRYTGSSFVTLKYPFIVLYQILMVLISVKPMKIFATLGFFILFLGAVLFGTELSRYFMGLTGKPVVHVNLVLGLSFFGVQCLFFGLLAELIVRMNIRRN